MTQPNSVTITVYTPQALQSLEIQVSFTYLLQTMTSSLEESKDLRHNGDQNIYLLGSKFFAAAASAALPIRKWVENE